ncbi:MAG: hypothetical protein ABDH32_02570 [Candidatus Caldarchaeales archaeon]
MVSTNYIDLSLVFTLNWLLYVSGGVLILLIMIYLLRRSTYHRPVEIKEKPEIEVKKIVGESLEVIAGISAVIASLSQTTKTVHIKEGSPTPPSIWKISSILNSLRDGEVH